MIYLVNSNLIIQQIRAQKLLAFGFLLLLLLFISLGSYALLAGKNQTKPKTTIASNEKKVATSAASTPQAVTPTPQPVVVNPPPLPAKTTPPPAQQKVAHQVATFTSVDGKNNTPTFTIKTGFLTYWLSVPTDSNCIGYARSAADCTITYSIHTLSGTPFITGTDPITLNSEGSDITRTIVHAGTGPGSYYLNIVTNKISSWSVEVKDFY